MPNFEKNKTIPIFWFGLTLSLWVGSYWIAFSSSAEHMKKMDDFMAAGGRFTQEDGDALAARINLLELQMEALHNGKRSK